MSPDAPLCPSCSCLRRPARPVLGVPDAACLRGDTSLSSLDAGWQADCALFGDSEAVAGDELKTSESEKEKSNSPSSAQLGLSNSMQHCAGGPSQAWWVGKPGLNKRLGRRQRLFIRARRGDPMGRGKDRCSQIGLITY